MRFGARAPAASPGPGPDASGVGKALALGWLSASPCSDSRTSPPLAVPGGVVRGSDIMKKALKRVLDRLRAASNGMFGKRTATRGGLQEPQQLQALPVPVRARP